MARVCVSAGGQADGVISVVPSGSGYRWAARRWALAPLQLGLRGRPLPLNGVLEVKAADGAAATARPRSVSNPAWLDQGRQLNWWLFRYPGFDVSADLSPQGSGSVRLRSRGAWNGRLDLQAEARKLEPGGVLRLLQDLTSSCQRP